MHDHFGWKVVRGRAGMTPSSFACRREMCADRSEGRVTGCRICSYTVCDAPPGSHTRPGGYTCFACTSGMANRLCQFCGNLCNSEELITARICSVCLAYAKPRLRNAGYITSGATPGVIARTLTSTNHALWHDGKECHCNNCGG